MVLHNPQRASMFRCSKRSTVYLAVMLLSSHVARDVMRRTTNPENPWKTACIFQALPSILLITISRKELPSKVFLLPRDVEIYSGVCLQVNVNHVNQFIREGVGKQSMPSHQNTLCHPSGSSHEQIASTVNIMHKGGRRALQVWTAGKLQQDILTFTCITPTLRGPPSS